MNAKHPQSNEQTKSSRPNLQSKLDIVVLFSLGISLQLWQKTGLGAREKAYYDRIVKQGHNVSLLTYGKDDLQYQDIWKPITVLPWIGKLTHFVKYACVAPFHHRQAFQQAHIVKSNQSQGSLVGVLAKLVNPKLKFVLRCGWVRTKDVIKNEEKRTGIKYYRAIFFEWLAVKLANAIIVVTQSDADYLIEHYSANSRKIHIIPNSIDTQQYQYQPSNIAQKIAKQEVLKLLLVGRLVEAKNFHKVFTVVSKISQNIEVTVIGDGEYREELQRNAELVGITADFLGNIANDELATHYAQHDIVVMPEAWGSGMPKVVLEAMASGAFIVASNIRSVQQLLRQGENGLICEPNTESIQASLEKVLAMSDQEFTKITATARHDIEFRYSMDSAVEKELNLYRALL